MLGAGLVVTVGAAGMVFMRDDATPRPDRSEPTVNTASSSTTAHAEPDTTDRVAPEATPPESNVLPTGPVPSTTNAATASSPATSSATDVEIQTAVLGYYDDYWDCLRAPADCDAARVTVEGSAAFDDLTAVAQTLDQNGLFVGSEETGYVVVESIDHRGDRASVTTCWWTTAVLYLQSPVDGDPPIAQTNPPTSGHQTYELVRDAADDAWRIERADQADDLTEDINQC